MKITKDHVFFWGGEFSNFHLCPVNVFGNEFANSEQAFMWAKAKTFEDQEMADLILQAKDPKVAKKLGRKIKNFDERIWAEEREEIMSDVCYAKFTQNENLKKLLLNTENRFLVEASPYDLVWGIGMSLDHPLIDFEEHWNGQNLLGIVLTNLREIIKLEEILNGRLQE